jgi:dienelactone hydrolase
MTRGPPPYFLLLFLLLSLHAPLRAGEETVLPRKVGEHGAGVLYRYGDRRVLVVRGTAQEMGFAHGRLLRREIAANVQAFVHDWALGRMGRTRAELEQIWKRIARHTPAVYHEELAGLAAGSGVPLADLQLIHALPSRYHCTGAAAMPAVTSDGKVYHTRSLDYALDIGATVRPQTNSLLLVSAPAKGIAHASVGWAGFLGCVTGMNAKGVSVGEMGSRSSEETYDGIPMIFLAREVLRRANDLEAAKEIWRRGPRTCGYNFICCDPAGVCAVELNRDLVRFFGPGDEKENRAPHYAIPGVVRRCNHFVDPELAGTQRKVYDPRRSAASSWTAYERQGRFLAEHRGRVDAEVMIRLLRGYPPPHACLHQAVMCPNDLALWVAQAKDPRSDPLAGAQNQTFLRYDLRSLLAGSPAPAQCFRTDRSVPEVAVETGRVAGEPRIEGVFAHEPATFPYRLEALRSLGGVTIHHLTYPSPGPSRFLENLTVHAEYYRPPGAGPFPAAVVLHILDGRFYAARLVAAALAQRGIAALFIKLPYYGERRPPGDVDLKSLDLPDVVTAIRQAVRDVRRGAFWLRRRPEVADGKVGIVGVSLGSFVAQLAAGADGGFDRCAFVLGGGSLTDTVYAGSKDTRKIVRLLTERGWDRAGVAEALAPIEPLRHVDGIAKRSVLMINCRADEVVPPASSRRYWEALGRPEIVWYDGGHYAIKDHAFEVLNRLGAHFAR